MEQYRPKIKLISASAGTGKTYSLIQEISRVLEHTDPSKVVAITFTRAATKDIRSRVHKKFSSTGIKNADDMNINTIHGFFAGILREQSIYFKHSADFKMLEEFDQRALFKKIASEVMIKKVADPVYEKFFAGYDFENVLEMLQKIENRYALIRDKLNTDIKTLLEQEKKAEYQKLQELISCDFIEAVAEPILTFKASSDEDKIEIKRQSVLGILPGLTELLENVRKSKDDFNSFYNAASLFKKMPSCAPGSGGKKEYWDKEQLEKVKAALKSLNTIRENVVKKYRLGEEWIIKQAAENRKIFFELFIDVHKEYENKRKELDALSFNDIERLTYDLVTKNPKVAQYYREKYDYIFVDEFQDTNFMQRNVLFEIAKQLFLVGDAKQSIYRFRNADVRVFIDTQNRCAKDEIEELTHNRRCLCKIIETVNKAFPEIFDYTHSAKRQDFEADYLRFEFGREEDIEKPGVVRFINAPSENPHPYSFNHKLEAEIALDIINKGIEEGKNYRDFALLFRVSNHMSEFEKLFREAGIPFVVYGGGSRYDLLSSLRSLFNLIIDPYDDHSMLEVLKLPYFYTSDEDIYKLKNGKEHIWEGLTTEFIKKFILDMRKIKDRGAFAEFVAEVLRISKFIPSASLVFTGQDIGAEEYILRAAKHVESEGEGIEYFMDYIYSRRTEDVGIEIDAVKLMTVHASKGLEFNSVIIPCLDHKPKGARDNIVISDDGEVAVKLSDDESNRKFNTVFYHNIKDYEAEADTAESKRTFYVAMTRARNELYMISDFSKGKGMCDKRWVDWLSGIFASDVEDYIFSSERIKALSKRKVIRTSPELVGEAPSVKYEVFRRYTVSAIRERVAGVKRVERSDDEEDTRNPKTRLGNIIHSVLENWDDKDAVAKIYERVGSDAAGHTAIIINDFVSSELGKKLLSAPKHLSEHSFAVKINNDIVSGRIDRLNIYDDHVWVVDYKSSVDEKELDGYKAQLACYLCFAESMFKGKKIMGSIIDVSQNREYVFDIEKLRPWIKDLL